MGILRVIFFRILRFMRYVPLIFLSVLGGSLIFLQIQKFGPFVSPDGVKYLLIAESLRKGLGFCIKDADGCNFESHWAPGFSVLLSLFPNHTLLNVLLASLSVFLLGLLLLNITRSILITTIYTLTFILSPTFLKNFSFLFSETLYIPMLLLALIFLKEYVEKRDLKHLLVLSILVGLGNLVRYAKFIYGVKFRDILIFLFFSLIPFLAWQVFSSLQGEPVRELALHFPSDFHYQVLWETLNGYVFPPYSDELKVVILVPILVFLLLSTFREKRTAILILGFVLVKIIKTHIHYEILILFFFSALFLLLIYRDLEVWGRILIWFLLGYLVFLFLSISFMDFHTLPDIRIMSPFFVIFLLLLSLVRSKFLPLPFLFSYSVFAINFINEKRLNGDGLKAPYWANLDILEDVRKLPKSAYVYSNVPEILYLHAGIYASFLPRAFNPNSNRENKKFMEEIREMAERIKRKDGFLVIIRPFRRYYLPSEEDLKRILPLQIYSERRDGAIYKIR